MTQPALRVRLRGAALALGLALAASGAGAQVWQPLGLSEPFPPNGTRICVEGGGERICLALFCPGPGTGLRIGWLDTTRVSTETAELNLSVDNPLAASDFMNPDARLVRLPRYPYFVAVGTLNPARAAGLLAAMRAGDMLTVEEAGNGFNLPLGGSAREIARALEICGAPATDPGWAGGQAVAGGSPLSDTASEIPAPAPEAPPGPAPEIAASWAPVPVDPVEAATGTQLCFGDALDPAPARCLRVGCFGPGTPAILWWQDERAPATGGEAPLALASAVGEAEALLSFVPAPDAPFRIGSGPLSAEARAVLGAEGILSLALAGNGWRVAATGAGDELARVGATCAMPAAVPAPAAAPATVPSPAAPRGLLRVELPEVDLSALDAPAAAAFEATQGEAVSDYRDAVGEPVQSPGVALFLLGADRQLLFTRLCGRGGFFGASGCIVDVFAGDGQGWSRVFFAPGTSDTFDLDLDRMTGGWPDIVVSGGTARWRWSGSGYEIE